MRRAGSLWHKSAGVATPRYSPRHRGGPTELNVSPSGGLSASKRSDEFPAFPEILKVSRSALIKAFRLSSTRFSSSSEDEPFSPSGRHQDNRFHTAIPLSVIKKLGDSQAEAAKRKIILQER